MDIVLGSLGVMTQHPVIVTLLFSAIFYFVIRWLSGNNTREALAGCWSIVVSIFQAPFTYLRRALDLFRSQDELAKPYIGSWEYMLHIANRASRLALLIGAVLVLSTGFASALIGLYPQYEITLSRVASEAVDAAEEELDAAEDALEKITDPDYIEDTKEKLTEQQVVLSKASERFSAAEADLKRAGEGLNLENVISDFGSMTSENDVTDLVGNLGDQIANGCTGWDGFNDARCALLKEKFEQMGLARMSVMSASNSAAETERLLTNMESERQDATTRVELATSGLESAEAEYSDVAVWKLKWLPSRISQAFWTVLSTIGVVIVLVWSAAITIDVVSWIAAMMLALEKKYTSGN